MTALGNSDQHSPIITVPVRTYTSDSSFVPTYSNIRADTRVWSAVVTKGLTKYLHAVLHVHS